MTLQLPALSIFLLVSGAICIWLAVHAWQQPRSAFARNFVGLMLCATLYAVGYGLELAAPDLAWMQVMLRLQYLGLPFVPVFWVGLAWAYLEPRGMPRRWQWLLMLLSGLVFVVFQSEALHALYYTSIALEMRNGIAIAVTAKGALYWFYIAYLNLATAFGVVLLFRAWRQAMPLYRRQALLLLAGSAMPWAFHLLYQLGFSPHGIDLGPFGMAAAGLAFGLAALRHRVLSVLPLARDLVFDSIAEGVIVLDTHGRIIDFNRPAQDFFPQLGPALLGADCTQLAAGEDFAAAIQTRESFIHPDRHRQLEIRRHPLNDPQSRRQGTALLISDVTEKLRLLAELREHASIDALTGCCNRRHLVERAEHEVTRALRHQRPLALIILDVDDFKTINEQRGHLGGDETLRQLAHQLRSRLRSSDILGRYGGDEFVIVLPETTSASALRIAQSLIEHCAAQYGTGLSMGVAGLEAPLASFTDLLRSADQALYDAKTQGKRRVSLYRSNAAQKLA